MLGRRAHGGPSCSLHMSCSSPVRWVQGLEGLDMGVRTRVGTPTISHLRSGGSWIPGPHTRQGPGNTPGPHHMAVEGLLPRDGGCVTTSHQGWADHMTVSPNPAPPTLQKGKPRHRAGEVKPSQPPSWKREHGSPFPAPTEDPGAHAGHLLGGSPRGLALPERQGVGAVSEEEAALRLR